MFSVGKKIKEYQQNYSEHILRMATYRILWKFNDYSPKERGKREVAYPRNGRINSCNSEIGTGQKA
jgi:hypothetical protein